MAITDATLRATKFWPELIPNAGIINLGAGARSARQIALDQVGLKQKVWVRMTDITQLLDATLTMTFSADKLQTEVDLAAVRNNVAEVFDAEAVDHLTFAYFATAPVVNHPWLHGLWVYKPTIAHKISRKQTLTPQEEELAKKYGLFDTVEKGLLPLPLGYQIAREYEVIQEITGVRAMALAAGITTVVTTLYCRPDEAIILTGFSCTPGAAGDITIDIDRDADSGFVSNMPTFPITLANDVPTFIPALKQIEIKATSVGGIGVGGFTIRYRHRRVRLTNILKARWGVASDLPGDVVDKVLCGIL